MFAILASIPDPDQRVPVLEDPPVNERTGVVGGPRTRRNA
ncbi:hypothetical protein [Amycolatopsis sp. cmx-11-12]